jgi:hypothetical protein
LKRTKKVKRKKKLVATTRKPFIAEMKERPKPMWAVLIIYAQLIALVNATGLFSTSPTILNKGDPIPLYLNKVFSFKTQLPYAYNELSFICPTSARASRPWINLGQVMRGDRIIESDYKVGFNISQQRTIQDIGIWS